ncbi:MAG: ABC transporter permease [Desulfitobacteriaceae bacterium]
MPRFILKRFLLMVLTLWVIVTLTFLLMHLIPGDPFTDENSFSPTIVANMKAFYGLDKPLPVQYGHYLVSLVQLKFGPSIKWESRTVNDMIREGFPVSAQLGLQAIALAVILGILFGVISALKHNQWPDYMAMTLAILGISVPSFVMATLLINFLGVKWGLLPPATWGTWRHTVMPTMALAFGPMAYIARLMRSSMLEVLAQDYIITAESKGLSFASTVIHHGIRNAIMPVVTVLGPLTASILTGSFVIEKIFGIPGLGKLFIGSIMDRDYPAILGTAVFYSAILIFLIFLVDVVNAYIDPRIKIVEGGNG